MATFPLVHKLIRDLKLRAGTLIALIFVLAIGVSCYTSMAGVYRDLNDARALYYNTYHLADFTLDLKRAPETLVARLENLPNIVRLRSRIKTDVMVELPLMQYSRKSSLIPGVAMSLPVPRSNVINDVKLYRGTWFSNNYAHEIILNEQFAKAHHLSVGDRIDIRLPEKKYDLLIVGTAYSPEYVMILPPGGTLAPDPGGYAVMYMPRKFLQEVSALNGSFNQLLGMTQDRSITAIENTMTLLSDKLENYGVQFQTSQREQISAKVLHDELTQVEKMTTIMPTMFLLIAALILNVMMNRLVTQQRISIGTLKAIGYSNFTLICHYLGYGVVIGLFGGLVGIGLGFILQYLMLIMYKTYFAIPNVFVHVYFDTLIIGVIISIFSAVLGSLTGVGSVVKLSPAVAMRPPMPEKGVHIFLEHFSLLWKKFSFQSRMILRAIFRNRFRSLVTISASILATALVFSSLQFLDAMDKMVLFTFHDTQHQDYTLSFRNPLGKKIIRHLEILPGVKKVEGQLSVATKLQHGMFYKLMEIVGLPEGHSLFTPVDKNNNPINIEAGGLIINQTLANILHVSVGDSITLRPLIGNRSVKTVKVRKIIKSYLGLAVYADQVWLSQLLGNSWVTNRALFKLDKGINLKDFSHAIGQFAPMINLQSLQEAKELLIDTLDRFLAFFVIMMIGFAGIIAVGSVINTAMISLNERERDVASLRVIGFTNFQVAKIFFGESLLLNIIGIIFGLFLGIGFSYWMSTAFSTEVYRMPVVIRHLRLFQTVLIMMGFVIVSQAMVYRFIVKMHWYGVLNARE